MFRWFQKAKVQPKKLLFVCGAPRSGTTALTHLLNTHPAIVLGVERYRRLLMGEGPRGEPDEVRKFIGQLFERDRLLFEQHPDDSRPFPPSEVASAAVKFDQCTYVGDKAPALFRRIEALGTALPDAKFVIIVRNPVPVAVSWQNRAERENDTWPATRDHRAAVTMWNESVKSALQALDAMAPHQIACVRYETLFAEATGRSQWFGLMDWLGLPADPPLFSHTRLMLADSARRASSPRCVPQHIEHHVQTTADLKLYAQLCRMTLPRRPARRKPFGSQ